MTKTAKTELVETSTEVVEVPAETSLTTVMDFDALVQASTNIAAHIGSGWTVVPTKEQHKLVGVPFVIVDIKRRDGDYGEYLSLQCRLRNALIIDSTETDRVVINDGSTGIMQQLLSMEVAPQLPYFISHGLRKSEYTYKDLDDGKEKPAFTYYLDAR